MPTFRIHNWDFHLWDGPAPGVVRQHVSTHTRPGTAGVIHTKLGQWGDPFNVKCSAYYATFALATDARKWIVEPLLDVAVTKVWYCGIDYYVRYQTLYKVTQITDVNCQMLIRVVGSGLNLANPTQLTATLTLQPHAGT